ncbi:MAG: N-formylglutamate amidohydrolase [Rhodobacteraceae bacterium]|nr:N-formylglutamate amidohydrolase [Paracoccaceae bacterium]
MPKDYVPYVTSGMERQSDVIVVCDHASNFVPPQIQGGNLGLPAADMNRHIAFDIGAKGVSLRLGELLDAPVICSNFSRLVVDPNRGEDDPTLLMRLYDGTIIPGNRHADDDEREQRLSLCYRPYHAALKNLIAARESPVLISIHSFTPRLNSRGPRPWHVGVLSGRDRRLGDALLHELASEQDICVGDNQPYNGELKGDCMDRHGTAHNRLHTLIELRHDLINTPEGEARWADRLAPLLQRAISAVSVAA